MAFVVAKILLHGRGLQLNKKYGISYVDPLCALGDGLANNPLPGRNDIGFIEFGLQML